MLLKMSPETRKRVQKIIGHDWTPRSTLQLIIITGTAVSILFGGGERVVGGIVNEAQFRYETKKRNEQQKEMIAKLEDIAEEQRSLSAAARTAAFSSLRGEARLDSVLAVINRKTEKSEAEHRAIWSEIESLHKTDIEVMGRITAIEKEEVSPQ